MHLILGSKSPRRRELLAGLDIPFTSITIETEETFPENLTAGDIPLYISKEKADAYRKQLKDDDLLITADTIVWVNGEMLGKPQNEQEAATMLQKLSGRTHQVYTGVCLTTTKQQKAFVTATDVTFKSLSKEEIAYYVAKYKPLDKAGAYGIQEWIGYVGVTAINGSYFNVMGLPVQRLSEELKTYL